MKHYGKSMENDLCFGDWTIFSLSNGQLPLIQLPIDHVSMVVSFIIPLSQGLFKYNKTLPWC